MMSLLQLLILMGYTATDLSMIKVTVLNNLTAREDTSRTDAAGIAKFRLEQGTYTVSASISTVEFAFNGISENVSFNPLSLSLNLNLIAVALKGDLVFQEIYYTGSKTPTQGSYYSDQFHEIYNNSDQIIYLDGLCIGLVEGSGTSATPWVKNDGTLRGLFANSISYIDVAGNWSAISSCPQDQYCTCPGCH